VAKDEDPCEVELNDCKPVDGRSLPHHIGVRLGNDEFGIFTVRKYELR
jgi:hypothetical protein